MEISFPIGLKNQTKPNKTKAALNGQESENVISALQLLARMQLLCPPGGERRDGARRCLLPQLWESSQSILNGGNTLQKLKVGHAMLVNVPFQFPL